MTPNKFQRRFLRQYRELHESTSAKRIMGVRILTSFFGSVVIVAAMAALLYFAGSPAYLLFAPFGVGIVLGNSASDLGTLIRRRGAWTIIEEITNWERVYELLNEKKEDGEG